MSTSSLIKYCHPSTSTPPPREEDHFVEKTAQNWRMQQTAKICTLIYHLLKTSLLLTYLGGRKNSRIFKKKIYSKYLYKSETLVPFEVLPLRLDAAIPAPLPMLETFSKIFNGNAVKRIAGGP